ncbi:MAG: hypothetical protein HGB11_00645 [Chlorobiales bacterium]|nr:hypothetical protein [Chlorobiales bacterium]
MSPAKLAKFKETIEKLVAEVQWNESQNARAGFIGEVIDATLEHNVRKVFINRMLTALGWVLEDTVAEEARLKGETTLFLDYLGVHLDTRIPLLIFEAKAWEKPFVSAATAAGRRQPPDELIARALNHIKVENDGTPPVIGEWIEWLVKLREYVINLKNQSDHVVSRVAISSGQWLVIFTEPASVFLEQTDVNPENILVFQTDDFVSYSDDIFGQISYGQLVDEIPSPLRPTQLTAFISANTVRRVFRALWISWKTSGSEGMYDTFPQIRVYPVVVIERADRVLLNVADAQRFQGSFVPSDVKDLKAHLDVVEGNLNRLLEAIFDELHFRFEVSDITLFPGFPISPLRGSTNSLVSYPEQPRKKFIRPWPNRAGEFLLLMGTSSHFLLEQPTVATCLGHNWPECRAVSMHIGEPIFSQRIDPKSFYTSGSSHHCAHRAIHDHRSDNCHVEVFESFLCCKACIFDQICWPEGTAAALPCGLPMEESTAC